MMQYRRAATCLLLLTTACVDRSPRIALASSDPRLDRNLLMKIGGRALVMPSARGVSYRRQWPGTYFETRFAGSAAAFRVGSGEVILNVFVDSELAGRLVKPQPGDYRVDGLSSSEHSLRIEVASEDQSNPTEFGGFYAVGASRPLPPSHRPRRMEFIGDSHTVGYGNTSPKRECTSKEVWETTDTSQSPGVLLGRRYNAEYQVNAISGRGIVRNYNGGHGDTLPLAYPFVLLNRQAPYESSGWEPHVVVVAAGTNDFTTPLKPGEKWKVRQDLHRDFHARYAKFVSDLRARYSRALIVLWATDMAEGEIASSAGKVVQAFRSAGDARVLFVPISGLDLGGCNYHPSLADDRKIADAIATAIDAASDVWKN